MSSAVGELHAAGSYELLLRFDDGRDELRLADHLDFFAHDRRMLEFRGQRWRITATEPPSQPGFTARLVCDPEVALRRTSSAARS